MKALKEFKREIDKDSINIFSNINYIPAPYTVYKNVYKLEPGSFIEIDTNFKGTMSIYKNKNINTTHFKKRNGGKLITAPNMTKISLIQKS